MPKIEMKLIVTKLEETQFALFKHLEASLLLKDIFCFNKIYNFA